jgi:Asp-tRNA(Asn)/Glu-tRNA(Gln) amidotransferase C subunit
MKTFTDPFFVARTPEFSFIDFAVWNGVEYVSQIQQETLEQVALRYPGAEIMEYEEVKALHDIAMVAKYVKPLKEVDEERFDEMLNVLPPAGWVRDGSTQSFKLVERTTGELTTIMVRYAGKYYEYTGSYKTRHADIIEYVRAEIEANRVTPKE